MSRKTALESGIEQRKLQELKLHWRHFRQDLDLNVESIDWLHKQVVSKGYGVSLSAFYADVAGIAEGKGVVQNPVLLNLVCEISGLDANRLFGLVRVADIEVKLRPEERNLIADTVVARLRQSDPRSKSGQAKQLPQRVRASWLSRLKTVRDGYQKLLGQLRFGKPITMDKANLFIRASVMNLPDPSDFMNLGYLNAFQSLWSTVTFQRGVSCWDLLSVLRMAVTGVVRTFRTIELLNAEQRIHTVRVIVVAERSLAAGYFGNYGGFLQASRSLHLNDIDSRQANDQTNWNDLRTLVALVLNAWSGLLQFQIIPRFNKAWNHQSVFEVIQHLAAGKNLDDVRVINDKVLFLSAKMVDDLTNALRGIRSFISPSGADVGTQPKVLPLSEAGDRHEANSELKMRFTSEEGKIFKIDPDSLQPVDESPHDTGSTSDEVESDFENMEYLKETAPGSLVYDLFDAEPSDTTDEPGDSDL